MYVKRGIQPITSSIYSRGNFRDYDFLIPYMVCSIEKKTIAKLFWGFKECHFLHI